MGHARRRQRKTGVESRDSQRFMERRYAASFIGHLFYYNMAVKGVEAGNENRRPLGHR